MGITAVEEIVRTVGAIMKTLECPICLETLKTPVSAGCGHFFCKECVSGILHSSYRAPCPLCKRSFTRRSIQEAYQRQTMIVAAKALDKTCSSLTGVNVLPQNYAEENRKSTDVPSTIPSKKFKTAPKENQDVSKKRKSWENEGFADRNTSKSDMKELTKENENIGRSESDEYLTAKKRAKSSRRAASSDSEDSSDLPELEDVLSQIAPSPKDIGRSAVKKITTDNPLKITPFDKLSKIKTYSCYQKKLGSKPKIPSFTSDSSEVDMREKSISKVIEKMSVDKDDDDDGYCEKDENDVQNTSLKKTREKSVKLRNKINALKNKTNKIDSDPFILKEDGFLSKSKDKRGKLSKTEQAVVSKENGMYSSSSTVPDLSPSKKIKKLRKSRVKIYRLSKTASLSTDEENSKINEAMNHKLVVEKAPVVVDEKECFNMEEIAISKSNHLNENKQVKNKPAEDLFKAMGLTDTAISVDSVTSPLAAKALSLRKRSPGWSRVKKVKKDFKMRQFSSLPIEKNSPQVSYKCSVSLVDCTASAQESVSKAGIDSENLDSDDQKGSSDIVKGMNNVKQVNSIEETPKNELESKKGNDGSTVREQDAELMDIDMQNITDNSENEKRPEEIDCVEVAIGNDVECNSSNFETNRNSGLLSKNSTKGINVENSAGPNSEDLSSVTINGVITAAGKPDLSSMSDKKCYNVGNSGEFSVIESFDGLGNPLPDGNTNENVISKQALVVYDSNSKQNAFCDGETPKLRKQKTLTLQARISEYDGFNTQSLLNENKDLQYVEHSQQTSQMHLNFENPNPMYTNFPLAVQQQLPFYTSGANAEKTKVVKRTCLTLDEVQDSFFKSSQSGCSETIYSAPFLSGQFKLDVRVSDETLNISVLKVIDSTAENNTSQYGVSMLYEKSIQTSDSLPRVQSPSVLPSSNSSSQPDNPNSAPDPFPYLSRPSNPDDVQPSPSHSVDMAIRDVDPSAKKVLAPKSPDKFVSINEENFICQENVAVNYLNMSEIIHFPKKFINENDKMEDIKDGSDQVQNGSNLSVQFNEPTDDKNVDENCPSPCEDDTEGTTVPFYTEAEDNSVDMVLCDDENNSKKIQKLYTHSCNDSMLPQKTNKSPQLVTMDSEVRPQNTNKSPKFVTMDSEVLPQKTIKSPQLVTIDSEDNELSDSDEELSLKILQQCASKGPVTKKKSRLSLKKKNKSRRLPSNSSEESDAENPEYATFCKDPPEDKYLSVSSVAEKQLGEILADAKSFQAPRPPTESLKNCGAQEMPCTLNSMLSEDAPDANASEIVLEIEDLSDKIKSLEEKLKQCGHSDTAKSQKHAHDSSKHLSFNVGGSDSEDSEDLFPQSVPPTPPEKCGNETSPGYKSSFYNA